MPALSRVLSSPHFLSPSATRFPPKIIKTLVPFGQIQRPRLRYVPLSASSSSTQEPAKYLEWDSTTSKFAGASNVPFLLIQLPQIWLNYQNLVAGNNGALFAVPWLGMLTGLLGNLTLLSYFVKKKEKEAIIVQTLGIISIYAVISQLAMAGALPLVQFTVTSIVIALGLVLNFLNYFQWLNNDIWQFWEDFITVGGLSVLPRVMWSPFVPFIPSSILLGTLSIIAAVTAVIMTCRHGLENFLKQG